jgi:lipoprotein NlpD
VPFIRRFTVVAIVLLLAACASHHRRPVVVDEGLSGAVSVPAYHIVQAGDTLYSLSLRYDRDYRELARLNHLDDAFHIFAGQKLMLNAAATAAASPKQVSPAPAVPVKAKPRPVSIAAVPAAAKPLVAKPLPDEPAPVAASAGVAAKAAATGLSTTKPKLPPPQKTVSETTPPATGVSQNTPPVGTPSKHLNESAEQDVEIPWAWPIKGAVIGNFSTNGVGNKGLDIAGRRGDAVLAAGDGVVVYVGAGLVGYGKLIIIRHNNNYLSAYAHNDRFMVTEGQRVKLGEKIAEVGSSGADRDGLHFEIRRQGKPVNPLQYLPPR